MFVPAVSVDCVVFGFHAGQLKVLLVSTIHPNEFALAGGFVLKDEDVETAAIRVLQERTGLENIFLQQFHCFGKAGRTNEQHAQKLLEIAGAKKHANHWILRRYISIGFYALVEFDRVIPGADLVGGQAAWHDADKLPKMIIDHAEIVETALANLRMHLSYQPVGYSLLPKYFALKDLQIIYETLLGKKLDRANFQRKILSYGILQKHEKHFTGNAHRAPFLYSFIRKKYFDALARGFDKSF